MKRLILITIIVLISCVSYADNLTNICMAQETRLNDMKGNEKIRVSGNQILFLVAMAEMCLADENGLNSLAKSKKRVALYYVDEIDKHKKVEKELEMQTNNQTNIK